MIAPSAAKSSSARDLVKKLLRDYWDPLGVGKETGAQDEYDGYAPTVLKLALEGRVNDLKDYLTSIEIEQMEMPANPTKNEMIAAMIVRRLAERHLA